MDINELREQIDIIDDALVRLFVKRMHMSAQIADYKVQHKLPIYVPSRENEILQVVGEKSGPDLANYTLELYSLIFELSRSYQSTSSGQTPPAAHIIGDSDESMPHVSTSIS